MRLAFRLPINSETLMRIAADMIMVNAALLTTLAAHFLWVVGIQGNAHLAHPLFQDFVQTYVGSLLLLTPISLIVFHLSGFYTHSRFYQDRYKALVITQAISLSYLLFSVLIFLLWDVISLPRSILLPAWLLTVVFLVGARWCLDYWSTFIWSEERPAPKSADKGRDKKILVIGGAGYIGSALLPKLLDAGYHVRLFDLLLYGTEPIQGFLSHPHLEIVRADFRQVDQMVQAMRNVETVIHLGAIVGDPACALDEELTIEINLMATRMIAEIAKGSGVSRFIFASTCSVYGASDEVLDEHSSLNPVSLYARSKIASEKVLVQMANDHFAPVILRFGTIYGFSGRTRFDLVVNLLTAKAVMENQITVFGGDQWRPFLHVDDAALALFEVLKAPLPLVNNQIFNVGSDQQNLTIHQVGEIIAGLVPTARLISMGLDGDQRNYRVNFSKIRRTLGFVPQWSVEQGVQQVMEAIQSGKILDYQNEEYSNVKFLSSNNNVISHLLRRQNGWAYDLLNESPPKYEVLAVA